MVDKERVTFSVDEERAALVDQERLELGLYAALALMLMKNGLLVWDCPLTDSPQRGITKPAQGIALGKHATLQYRANGPALNVG